MIYPLCKSLVTPLTRPLRHGADVFDASALAYINAVAAVTTVTANQKSAINAFVVGEKIAGRWSKFNRLFIHGWGNASANCIDMVSLVTGVFSSGVTHSNGYIYSPTLNGYFDTNLKPSTQGVTDANVSFGVLAYTASSTSTILVGSYDTTPYFALGVSTGGLGGRVVLNSRQYLPINTVSDMNGVLIVSRDSGNDYLYQRQNDATTLIVDTTAAAGLLALSTYHYYVMALNQAAVGAAAFADGRFGASFFGTALTKNDSIYFSANLQTLWQTLFGLVLPNHNLE